MSSYESAAEAVQLKPCTACRKRKVKCDKLRPCSNCSRTKQTCIYDGADTGGDNLRDAANSSTGDAELRERLARLEEMMAAMMGDNRAQVPARNGLQGALPALNDATKMILPTSQSQDLQPSLTPSKSSPKFPPIGQIVFQEGEGAYFNADYWPGLFSEIEDLRRIFDDPGNHNESSQWTSLSLLGIPSIFSSADLTLAHPSLEESNMLLKLFFHCVNPFIRVLHQSLFAKELNQYRRGSFVWPNEFEALLFSVYLLTINSLRHEVLASVFSESKDALLGRYQYAAQVSLTKIDFFKTQKIPGLWAVLHYITFLFQQNVHKDAVSLLGIASRQAQAMGLHRDPSQFPFSPWVCELRRRIWNHLCNLDALAITQYGAESCLPPVSDSQPPQNANDSDWHASRFTNPSSVPSEVSGFKEMSYVLARREISDTIRVLAKVDSNDFKTKEDSINQTKHRVEETYLQGLMSDDPSYMVMKALVEIRFSSLRLSVQYRQSKLSKVQPQTLENQNVFASALELLEAYESHATTFMPFNWEWAFETDIPWLAIAILIIELPKVSQQVEHDRAQAQVDRIVRMYGASHVSTTPTWKMLLQLLQRAQPDSLITINSESYSLPTGVFADDFMLDLGDIGVGEEDIDFTAHTSMQNLEDIPW